MLLCLNTSSGDSRAVLCYAVLSCVSPADHVVRALRQLGFDEWATEVRASHEEFKEEAKSEWGHVCVCVGGGGGGQHGGHS